MKTQSPTWPRGASAPTNTNPAPPSADPSSKVLVAHLPAPGGGPPPPPPPPPPPLDLRDPGAVKRWADDTRAALLDLAASAQEGARRPHKRVLSRGEIRRQAKDALGHATNLLDLVVSALRKAA